MIMSVERGRRPELTRFASGAKRTSQIREQFGRVSEAGFACSAGNSHAPHGLGPGTPRAHV